MTVFAYTGADGEVLRIPSESALRRVSRRNSSVLIIRPVPATAAGREPEFGGGIATATARLFPTVSAGRELPQQYERGPALPSALQDR